MKKSSLFKIHWQFVILSSNLTKLYRNPRLTGKTPCLNPADGLECRLNNIKETVA
jgi:hypothetical protein